jgi:hypothetical protein
MGRWRFVEGLVMVCDIETDGRKGEVVKGDMGGKQD